MKIKENIKGINESFRNPKVPRVGVDSFAFSANAWTHTVPLPRYKSFCTHRFPHWSISFSKAALKNKQRGNDLGLVPAGLVLTWIFPLVLFMVQLHKKDVSAQLWRQRAAVHNRMSGQWQGVLKKEHKNLLHLSNKWWDPGEKKSLPLLYPAINHTKNPIWFLSKKTPFIFFPSNADF